MTDIKTHIEAIRSIFKKRFSGEFSNFNGNKSPDIFKGNDDIEENFDWKNYGDELDKFDDDICEYMDEKKLDSPTVEEIMKNLVSLFMQKNNQLCCLKNIGKYRLNKLKIQ